MNVMFMVSFVIFSLILSGVAGHGFLDELAGWSIVLMSLFCMFWAGFFFARMGSLQFVTIVAP